MFRIIFLLGVLVVFPGFLGVGYAHPISPAVQCEAASNDPDQIRDMMARWLDAYNNRRVEDLLALYSDDIYYANNGSELISGLDAVSSHWKQQLSADTGVQIEFREELVRVRGLSGYIAGKYKVFNPDKQREKPLGFGRVLLIFERADCRSDWKLVVDFDNTGADAGF